MKSCYSVLIWWEYNIIENPFSPHSFEQVLFSIYSSHLANKERGGINKKLFLFGENKTDRISKVS